MKLCVLGSLKKQSYFIIIVICLLIISSLSCSKSVRFTGIKPYLKEKKRDRQPNFLFKGKVESYFQKWHSESVPISDEELNDLDSLSYKAYAIYEDFMSDTLLLRQVLYIDQQYKYVIIPDKIEVTITDCPKIDSLWSFNDFDIYDIIQNSKKESLLITNFRPRINNRDCLYYTDKYKKGFPSFSLRYGVRPFVLIDSPLMFGGDRFMETSPFVRKIFIFRNTDLIGIEHSSRTTEYVSFFRYKNEKLIFVEHYYMLAID
jgi:hypothetical protein